MAVRAGSVDENSPARSEAPGATCCGRPALEALGGDRNEPPHGSGHGFGAPAARRHGVARRSRATLRRDLHSRARSGGLRRSGTPGPPRAGRTWVSAGGSSGRTKRVAHTLAGVTTVKRPRNAADGSSPSPRAAVPGGNSSPCPWQCPARISSGWGVDAHQLEHWADLTAAEGVTAVSVTPTFWASCAAAHRPRPVRLSRCMTAAPVSVVLFGQGGHRPPSAEDPERESPVRSPYHGVGLTTGRV